MGKKLFKSSNDKVLAGVCGGIAEYFVVDSVIIRLLWVVFTLMGGAGLIAYIIAAIIIPSDPLNGSMSENYSRSENYGSEQRNNTASRSSSLILGIILILFGASVLLKGYFPWLHKDIFLAVFLIGLGIFFLVRKCR